MKLDLDELEKGARAATPGPWEAEPQCGRGAWIKSTKTGQWTALSCGDGPCADAEGAANAAHIATCDPPTVLALIAEAREAETLRAAVRELAGALEPFATTGAGSINDIRRADAALASPAVVAARKDET